MTIRGDGMQAAGGRKVSLSPSHAPLGRLGRHDSRAMDGWTARLELDSWGFFGGGRDLGMVLGCFFEKKCHIDEIR